MRARANVDAGAPLPDRSTRLGGARGARPTDGTFRELGPGVLPGLESADSASFSGTLINGGGASDGKARLTANEAGETHR